MCGIAGVVALSGALGREDAATVGRMTESLRHRGPDGSGTWTSDRVVLGHRRLSIIDTSDCGHQPMVSRSGRFAISFNGEIYNHVELGERFRRDGWTPVGHSDTEVLLESIERSGLDVTLDRLDGMFAFALVDRDLGEVCLVRDRFGEKPLVHFTGAGRMWFGSDASIFGEVPDFGKSVSEDAVRDLLRHGFIDGHLSVFEGVEKLAPGTVLRIRLADGSRTTRTYWTVPSPGTAVPTESPDTVDRLESLLTASIGRRMHSDRPLGAFLSGGIDSALTCALAARMVPNLDTFTMTWADREYDESDQAALIARRIGARHHAVRLDEASLLDGVRRVATVFDEPFADSSAVAVHAVASFARESVVVCLSGDGGDEMFGGYNRHRWLLRLRRGRSVPAPLRRSAAFVLAKSAVAAEKILGPVPTARRPRLVRDKMTKLARAVGADGAADSYANVLAQCEVDGPARALPAGLATALEQGSDDEFLWAIRAADICGYLPDDILTKVDRATMSVGLECRTPYLEREICEFAMAMGVTELIGPDGGKQPMRRLLARLLPDVSFAQPKTGFGVPIARLLRGGLREAMLDAAASFDSRGMIKETSFAGAAQTMTRGDDSLVPALWAVLMFEMWADSHLRPAAR